jgi:hypothetical protein
MTIPPQVELYPSLLLLVFALLGIACVVAGQQRRGHE